MQKENTPQDGAESAWASLRYSVLQVSKVATGVIVGFLLVMGILWLIVQFAMLFLPKELAPGVGMLAFTMLLGVGVVFAKRRHEMGNQTGKSQSQGGHGRGKGERR
ncbi:hypothetical protein [Thermomonas fusca]